MARHGRFKGGRGDDRLEGGAGNDKIKGGAGVDTFVASAGRDVIKDFTADEDVLDLSGIAGIETLDDLLALARERSGKLVLEFEDGRLILKGVELEDLDEDNVRFGSEDEEDKREDEEDEDDEENEDEDDGEEFQGGRGNDRLKGGEGDDVFNGGAGNDRLKGGMGDDILDGGAGNDRLVGGEGADTFVFSAGRDVIKDFAAGEDLLDLSGVAGIETLEDVWDAARERGDKVMLHLDEGRLILKGVELADLGADDFLL